MLLGLLRLSWRVLWRAWRRLHWIVTVATTARLAARWRRRLVRGGILPLLPQPGVDLLGTQIGKRWIDNFGQRLLGNEEFVLAAHVRLRAVAGGNFLRGLSIMF